MIISSTIKSSRSGAVRYSGLQKQVLGLYRQLWRATKNKESPLMLKKFIRKEFETYKTIPKHETTRIEWFLRNGYTKLELLQNEQCTNITFFY